MNKSDKPQPPANFPTISRREFLKKAGLTAAALSAAPILASCAPAAPAATTVPAAAATPVVNAPVVLKGAKVAYLGGPWSFLPELDPVIDTFANDWAKQNNGSKKC